MIAQCTPAEAAYFASLIGYTPSIGFKAIKHTKDDKVLAVVGYDYWTPNSVQMHIWIQSPKAFSSRQFIREAFRYPFEICGRGLVIGVTPGDNAKALEFNRRIGFREVYRIKDGWSLGTDVVIQEMRRAECRWLDQRYQDVPRKRRTADGTESRPATTWRTATGLAPR